MGQSIRKKGLRGELEKRVSGSLRGLDSKTKNALLAVAVALVDPIDVLPRRVRGQGLYRTNKSRIDRAYSSKQ